MSDLSHKIYFVYSIFDNITVYLIVILTIFLILAIITIMNSVSTSILKSKKELGILISFKIQKNL